VPCWVEEMDDQRAFMELVLSNSQGELSPLERGLHALWSVELGTRGKGNKGDGLKAYAKATGQRTDTVSKLRAAAEVYVATAKDCHVATITDLTYHLYTVHAAPRATWTLLVQHVIAKKLSVKDTEVWVRTASESDVAWSALRPAGDVDRGRSYEGLT